MLEFARAALQVGATRRRLAILAALLLFAGPVAWQYSRTFPEFPDVGHLLAGWAGAIFLVDGLVSWHRAETPPKPTREGDRCPDFWHDAVMEFGKWCPSCDSPPVKQERPYFFSVFLGSVLGAFVLFIDDIRDTVESRKR